MIFIQIIMNFEPNFFSLFSAKHGTNKLLRHSEKCFDSLVKLNREDILELMLGCLNISGEHLSKSKMSAAFEKYNPFRSSDM